MKARKLGEATINGKAVSFFSPPHDEPDFPWVDVYELARAFVPKPKAKELVERSKRFSKGPSAVSTARNGAKVSIIMCHAMAHGLMMTIDFGNGWRKDDENGPAFREYSTAAARMAADKMDLSFEEMAHAFQNPGGPFLRNAKI